MCRSGQKNYAEKTPEKNKAHEAKIQHGILIIEGNELISNRLLWNFCTLKPVKKKFRPEKTILPRSISKVRVN